MWFPHLTYDLVQSGLQKLYNETEITEAKYGTARVMLKDANAAQLIEEVIFTRNDFEETKNETIVERLPATIIQLYKESGVDFYTKKELSSNTEITDCLRQSFQTIRYIPSLFTTVHYLVKSIHLIEPENNEYDVSFSEPHVPFSIFVSVPRKNGVINTLRVAEAIVHEAMHLQLTLIETIIPLVTTYEKKFYSPWKTEYRSVSGVLHALFVFKVLQAFFLKLLNFYLFSPEPKNYLYERLSLIARQIDQIKEFANCSALTSQGKILAQRCLTVTL